MCSGSETCDTDLCYCSTILQVTVYSMRSMRGGIIFRNRGPLLKVHHGVCHDGYVHMCVHGGTQIHTQCVIQRKIINRTHSLRLYTYRNDVTCDIKSDCSRSISCFAPRRIDQNDKMNSLFDIGVTNVANWRFSISDKFRIEDQPSRLGRGCTVRKITRSMVGWTLRHRIRSRQR